MRELKFRAWHNDWNKMIDLYQNPQFIDEGDYWISPNGELHEVGVSQSEIWTNEVNATLMQYTGLKDRNDREIYEGDIVMITETYDGKNKVYKSKVEFHESCFLVWEPDGTDLPLFCFYTPDIPDGLTLRISVIGNIYENPELLGDSK